MRFYFGNETYQPLSQSTGTGKLNTLNKTQNVEYKQVLKLFCNFITGHFSDSRIVNNDHKELITQSLSSLITSKQGLNILENISIENRINLIKKLTQPFENRSWVNSNWILLRFWKGNGYAFKKETFHKLSNSLSDDNLNLFTKNDLISNSNDVNPSLVFQQLLCDYFNSNPKQAFVFLTSLLNQLNFSFSEFVNVVNVFQDVQSSSIRQDSSAKICCTCYDLSNALLRVLEMIVHYNASLILTGSSITTCVNKCLNEHLFDVGNENYESTKLKSYFGIVDDDATFAFDANFGNLENNFDNFDDTTSFESTFNFDGSNYNKLDSTKPKTTKDRPFGKETNEILLQQLCSICNQILNRVTMSSKCFKYVRQQLTNLDSMNEFNILSSVTAVLVELIVRNERTRYLTLNLLINDLNFQLSSYLYLIGQDTCCLNKLGSDCDDASNCDNCSGATKSGSNSLKNRTKQANACNFVNYLSDDELRELKRMLTYIVSLERNEKFKLSENYQEEDLCTICYANKKSEALFIPCGHQACKTCITIHFLRNSDCFFCKMQLEKVQFTGTNQVLYPRVEIVKNQK